MKTKIKSTLLLLSLAMGIALTANGQIKLFRKLKKYCDALPAGFNQIPDERKQTLQEIGDWIISRRNEHKNATITVICTQNSRRSHMGQIWIRTAAYYYGVDSVNSFSGGTNASAFNPRAIAALERAGFAISKLIEDIPGNPKYNASMGPELGYYMMYSKKYNDRINPKEDFGAIMVCSEADQSCPVVEGAVARFSLPYDDPKYYDNTPSEKQKYDERCKQIATEIFYVFDYVKKKQILDSEKARR